MKILNIKKGFNHPLTEKITPHIEITRTTKTIGLIPSQIYGIKPKLLVEKGDKVKIGTPLFCAKNRQDLVFLSPGAGIVSEIEIGNKRVINKIEVELDQYEDHEELLPITETALRSSSREDIVDALKNDGLWPYLRSFPYNTIPLYDEVPRKIFVKLSDNAPFYPLPETWLRHRQKAFSHGINILKKLCSEVIVYGDKNNHFMRSECQNTINFLVDGNYPSFDPGVVLYNLKKSPDDNKSWYIDGQNIINIGETLLHGKYFTNKIFIVGGPEIGKAYHVSSRSGVPVKSLLKNDAFKNRQRFISGDIFNGFTSDIEGYTGFYESSLTILPEGDEKEFMAFLKAGAKKQSFSNTFLSSILKSETETDCSTNGEKRACINCGYCESVCPVDILPQFTMKALYADDIETALSHGLLDCVNCSLCSYVCPSKISLSSIFFDAKDKFLKEEKA